MSRHRRRQLLLLAVALLAVFGVKAGADHFWLGVTLAVVLVALGLVRIGDSKSEVTNASVPSARDAVRLLTAGFVVGVPVTIGFLVLGALGVDRGFFLLLGGLGVVWTTAVGYSARKARVVAR